MKASAFDPLAKRKGARWLAVPEWLWKVSGLKREAALCYGALASELRMHGECCLGYAEIGKRVGVERRQAIRHVQHLESLGLLRIHRRRQEGRLQHELNSYELLPHPAAAGVLQGTAGAAEAGVSQDTAGAAEAAPKSSRLVSAGAKAGVLHDTLLREDLKRSEEPTVRVLVRDQIYGLEQRYEAHLVQQAREACGLTRRSGKLSDPVWLQVLTKLQSMPLEAVAYAFRQFSERCADGSKNESYMLAIARRKAGDLTNGRSRERGPVAAKSDAEFVVHPGDDDFPDIPQQGHLHG